LTALRQPHKLFAAAPAMRKGYPMSDTRPDDSWNKGDPYERYVGRWSGLVVDECLGWLDLPPSLRWLDVGCGTGERLPVQADGPIPLGARAWAIRSRAPD
jgi:hypothetical protein